MAISLVNKVTFGPGTGNFALQYTSLNEPSVGNFVCIFLIGPTNLPNPGAGWNSPENGWTFATIGGGTTGPYYKFWSGSDTLTETVATAISGGAGSPTWYALAYEFSGVDGIIPIGPNHVLPNGTYSGPPWAMNSTGITPITNGSLPLSFVLAEVTSSSDMPIPNGATYADTGTTWTNDLFLNIIEDAFPPNGINFAWAVAHGTTTNVSVAPTITFTGPASGNGSISNPTGFTLLLNPFADPSFQVTQVGFQVFGSPPISSHTINANLTDTISVSSAVTRVADYTRALSLTFTTTDSVSAQWTLIRGLNETFELSNELTGETSAGCLVLPPIKLTKLVSQGAQSSADIQNNNYLVLYKNMTEPDNILGNINQGGNLINWIPPLGQTGIVQQIVIKDFNTDCVFWPTFDTWNTPLGLFFGVAWQENMPNGRLNIKYIDYPTMTQTVSGTPSVSAPNSIYIYPSIVKTLAGVKTSNIPLNSIKTVDINNNVFNLDGYADYVNGYEFSLPVGIQKVQFVQTFRQPNSVIQGTLTTAPGQSLAGSLSLIPLSAVPINIYYGTTSMVFKRLFTDVNGQINVTIPPGLYTFEIVVLYDSMSYQQIYL